MRVLAIIAVLGFGFCVIWQVVSVMKSKEPIPIWGFYANAAAGFLAIAIVAVSWVAVTDYAAASEKQQRKLLQKVASAQANIYLQQGNFGQKPDVIKEQISLFGEEFEIQNGEDGQTTYLMTNRCEMVLIKKRVLGPSCESRKSSLAKDSPKARDKS